MHKINQHECIKSITHECIKSINMNQHDIASTTTSRHSINGHTKTFIVSTRHIRAYQGTLEHWIGTLEDTSHILSFIYINSYIMAFRYYHNDIVTACLCKTVNYQNRLSILLLSVHNRSLKLQWGKSTKYIVLVAREHPGRIINE